ncbi:MAG: F0F1 ATP synthase subunit B [Desulfovibrio sp.]
MKRLHVIILSVVTVLATAAIAYASGGDAHGGGEAHALPWGNYFYRVVNLLIFLFIIWKFAGDKIGALVGGRRKQIQVDLDDLQARKAEAEAKLTEVEASIANLDAEKQAILDQAKEQGEALKVAIIEKAESDAEIIKATAKRSAENEAKGAIDALRAEMAELVIEAATKSLEEKLSEQDHEKLVDEYLEKVVLN